MIRLKIKSGLIELEMCSYIKKINMYIYDEYTNNYVSMSLSNEELLKIRDYMNSVLDTADENFGDS